MAFEPAMRASFLLLLFLVFFFFQAPGNASLFSVSLRLCSLLPDFVPLDLGNSLNFSLPPFRFRVDFAFGPILYYLCFSTFRREISMRPTPIAPPPFQGNFPPPQFPLGGTVFLAACGFPRIIRLCFG